MIYTLNLSAHFTDCITDFILAQKQNPIQLAQTRIILPTKRACRCMKEAFIRRCGNQPLLLPQLTALYEIENLNEYIPDGISSTERLFLLARLCLAKPNINTLDEAIKIAMSLTQILDEFYLHEASLDQLEKIVPYHELATHWNESIEFLDILRKAWPEILKEHGKIDAADRRIRLIKHLTHQIQSGSINEPIILAGFDGAIPAVNNLIKALTNKNNALIFLDGMNNNINEEGWENIHANHYQYTFKKLLKSLKRNSESIPLLTENTVLHEPLIHESLKPAEQIEEWRHIALNSKVLNNVHRIDCETLNEEALTIATLLRQVLETPEKTGALVTTDRNLARRVILEMRRWGVELDDSAGTPLHHTPVGVYLSLLADYALQGGNGQSTVTLLKHPLAADGFYPTELRYKVRIAEKTARQKNARLYYPLQSDLTSFLTYFTNNIPVSFETLLTEHLKAAELLATSNDRSGIERLWQSDAGEQAYRFFNELKEHAHIVGNILPEHYPGTLALLMSGLSVRPKFGMHPRLDILGPIEARLAHPDVCIIGGLNEGTFPTQPDTGPWLSRPMRIAAGLPPLEAEIGTQCMDFAHCFCAKEVYLTRSMKMDGSQTIPSRFLSRIEAVLNGAGQNWKIHKPYISRMIDKPENYEKIERPMPAPPKELRPKKLPVTGIEKLMQNPYGIYAQYILNLKKLPDLEKYSENRAFGIAIHAAIETMLKNNNFHFNSNLLLKEMKAKLKALNITDSDLALCLPRLKKMADFIMERHKEQNNFIKDLFTETCGAIHFDLCDGTSFTLTAQADRIDIKKDNTAEIIDYKTGVTPSQSEITKGMKPQLPLEGLILQQGGFSDIKTRPNDIALTFWKITGKNQGGEVKNMIIKSDDDNGFDLLKSSFEGVKNLLNAYQNSTKPYESQPNPKIVKYDEYDHLARVKEWLSEDDTEGATE